MHTEDLVVGRLYKINHKHSLLGPEKEENLYMFLRVDGKKAKMLSLEGDYKIFDVKDLKTPRSNYSEVFSKSVINELFPLMKQFILEFKKYDKIKYSKHTGFKSRGKSLKKLNGIHRDIEKLQVTPLLTPAVENYFNVYKKLGFNFETVEHLMVNFLFIKDWSNTCKKLRGFSFNSPKFPDSKIAKFSQDALILHHLYTNICLKPNFKNVKIEWIDLLITKVHFSTYNDSSKKEVIKFLAKIKEFCAPREEDDSFANLDEEKSPIPIKRSTTNTSGLNTLTFEELIKNNEHKVKSL